MIPPEARCCLGGYPAYTWLPTLLLGWAVALLSAKDIKQVWQYLPYFTFLPILGLCFSVIAFFVVRREFVFYTDRTPSCCTSRRCLALPTVTNYLPWKARIRALFLLEFVVFATISVAEIVVCTVAVFATLWARRQPCHGPSNATSTPSTTSHGVKTRPGHVAHRRRSACETYAHMTICAGPHHLPWDPSTSAPPLHRRAVRPHACATDGESTAR
jgi:hypothetical protein